GLLGEADAVVREDAHPEAVDLRPARHERLAVERLPLVEARPVHDAGHDLADLERDAEVDRGDAEQVLGVVARRLAGARGSGPELPPAGTLEDEAADPAGGRPGPRP